MKCPFCKEEMQDKGLLNFTPLVKGIKLTSMSDGMTVKVFYCEACRKFIIDQDDLR